MHRLGELLRRLHLAHNLRAPAGRLHPSVFRFVPGRPLMQRHPLPRTQDKGLGPEVELLYNGTLKVFCNNPRGLEKSEVSPRELVTLLSAVAPPLLTVRGRVELQSEDESSETEMESEHEPENEAEMPTFPPFSGLYLNLNFRSSAARLAQLRAAFG
jgi:hypothetical protein